MKEIVLTLIMAALFSNGFFGTDVLAEESIDEMYLKPSGQMINVSESFYYHKPNGNLAEAATCHYISGWSPDMVAAFYGFKYSPLEKVDINCNSLWCLFTCITPGCTCVNNRCQ